MPTTTSTILFTDAVGSTELRADLGEAAADTLFRGHERALQDVVNSHGGKVVKTAGDGVMAAFDSSTDAVQAVVAGGRNAATLSSGSPVTVRLEEPATVTVERD